ncbi:MAG: hypothetical protein HKN70_04200 [Gammaproteobacteria bacterium]|nr:hypothetical protein [Gammaproteobacteria bacterium]
MFRHKLAALVAVAFIIAANASATGNPWSDIAESALRVSAQDRLIIPNRYRTVQVDYATLQAHLENAPAEFSKNHGTIFTLPMPDGKYIRFAVEDSPIMEPALAAKYPQARTFRVLDHDGSGISGRLGWTTAGFHAMVFTPHGTVFIDPYSRGDVNHYISYFSRDYRRADDEPFVCEVRSDGQHLAGIATDAPKQGLIRAPGDMLRTYRLAMAATFEYTSFHSTGVLPTKTEAMNNGIIPTMNRVNGVYERDISARMVLVANNEDIVFDTPADPYVNEDGISMLATNPSVLDNVIGNANYDIGHVFSTGGGGVAGLGVVCRNGLGFGHKASGVTGRGAPVGDPFDIDYVAHEIGHQFGGNHTFNGSTGSCSGSNRNGSTAYEVGSGTTIMAYAGICGAQNTQSNSDDLFHLASLLEMSAYSTSGAGDGCPAKTATGNTQPFVNAGADFTIPASTPFRLTASGGDNDGDTVTYAWEQYDLGAAGGSTVDTGNGPLFRAFNTSSSPTRVFPQNAEKPAGPFPYGELLPTTCRTMKFRVTARDNASAAGSFAWDEMVVTVDCNAAFDVTAPVDADVFSGNSAQSVNWTTIGVSDPLVDLFISLDGGTTYSVLEAGVTNDGTHVVTLPNVDTTEAVIQVAASGNIYFDVSELFTIEAVLDDLDGDGVIDAEDNCPAVANAAQLDSDSDLVGDACDNCILVANGGQDGNPSQCDTNGDGYGNACDGDLNNNGVINFVDLGMFKSVFTTADADADLNCNGVVNFVDLGLLKSRFMQTPGPSALVP